MTAVSKHIYAATLLPDIVLSMKGGSITLDATKRPHALGTLTIALPEEATLEALDPRMSPAPRIRIDVDATFPYGVQSRSFDLTLRDVTLNHADATLTLALASDEALLTDFAPLADDATPLQYQASLRGLVGYVLDTVIPGAVLEPGPDVPVPALAASSNLIRNPRAGVGTTDWLATWSTGGLTPARQTTGGPSYSPTYVAYLSAAGVITNGAEIFINEAAVSVTGGKWYVLSVALAGAAGRQLIVDAVCFDATGNIVGFIPPVTHVAAGGSVWARVATAPFEAYANSTRIRVRVRAAQLGGSEYVNVTAWRLSEVTGDTVADGTYFDGTTPDTAQYDYLWEQTAHASISSRKVKIDAATPEALTWQAGQDAMSFLAPLVQAAGLRLVCDEQRAWTLRDEDYSAAGHIEVRHAVNLIDGREKVARDDRFWFDAAAAVYAWTDGSGVRRERVDTYALDADYTLLRRFDLTTPYPGPGFAEYAVRRAQGRGREVSVTTVADWNVKAEQSFTAVLEGAPTQIGQTNIVSFSFDTDEVTITSRTVDTPAGAIDLLPGTIDALTGTINSL